jgi:hypothetical protein
MFTLLLFSSKRRELDEFKKGIAKRKKELEERRMV